MGLSRIGFGAALVAAIAALGIAFGAASVGLAAPKPGFLPGTWIGTGTISGSGPAVGGPAATFEGKLAFTMTVRRNGAVSGTGSWSRTMTSVDPGVSAIIAAKTSVQVSGSSTAPRLVGTYRAVGTFVGHGVSKTSTFAPATLNETLVITRAGKCRASGSSTVKGVTTTWTAQLKGSGKCNA
jgi:hypothetical protein